MAHADLIIFSDPATADAAARYEQELPSKALSEKLLDCQAFGDNVDELSLAKLILLYALGGDEARHEVKRVLAWSHRVEKANFIVGQLQSGDPRIIECSVELLGVLRERLASPALAFIFDVREAGLAKVIVKSLSEIGGSIAVATIVQALSAADVELVRLAVESIAPLVEEVRWTTFRPLLSHSDGGVRTEAAFAICVRRVPESARSLLAALERETDTDVRRHLIHDIGIVPNTAIVPPLLRIIVHDPDQKARLMATRALDRLQGILHSGALFALRKHRDVRVRAEVLSRLGKFGSDVEKHKDYLRRTLSESTDVFVIQACLQALGNIAERRDRDVLESFLVGEPVAAYCAALSLIRVLRLEDAGQLLDHVVSIRSPSLRQVFLKYLIRRRGFSVRADELLRKLMILLSGENNINVRYLTFLLLRFAPGVETFEFLLASFHACANRFERSAIESSIRYLALHHPDDVVALIRRCGSAVCRDVIGYIPSGMDASFYRRVAEALFEKCGTAGCEEGVQEHVRDMIRIIISSPPAVREFLRVVPDAHWTVFVLQALVEHADRGTIAGLKGELVGMLAHDDEEVRSLAMMLILSLRDPEIVPHLVGIAEHDPREAIRKAARHASRVLIREGVL